MEETKMETTLPTEQEAVTEPQTQAPTKLSQKEAVFLYVTEALHGVTITEGTPPITEGTPLKTLVTKDVRKVVRTKLFDGIKSGVIKYSPSKTDAEIKKYCSGLINNWLGKDERFS